jgi:RNA polymerase sigma factor (sigma-70 family)
MAELTQGIPLLTHVIREPMKTARAGGDGEAISLLTRRLAAGDEEAFREFHDAYFDRLFRYQLVMARGDEDAAHEALQETLLRVVRHARPFDNEKAFWDWLAVLARSAARDGGRKQTRYWRMLSNYARSFFGLNDDTSGASDADARLHEVLEASLVELEPEDRCLLEAKYFRRASVRELADETGLTGKAVESRLLRARRALRERIVQKLRHENET